MLLTIKYLRQEWIVKRKVLKRYKFQHKIILSKDVRQEQSYEVSCLSLQLVLNVSDTS